MTGQGASRGQDDALGGPLEQVLLDGAGQGAEQEHGGEEQHGPEQLPAGLHRGEQRPDEQRLCERRRGAAEGDECDQDQRRAVLAQVGDQLAQPGPRDGLDGAGLLNGHEGRPGSGDGQPAC